MIKLSDGELLDLLPAQLKYDTDTICLSYALKCGIEKLLAYEKGTMTANFIDYLPEKILDVLAVEMRSLYYLDSMDIETKRRIIKNTFIWNFRAGTAGAVSEMIETIFGEGSLIEWFDFDGDPYTYKIQTNASLTEDIFNTLSTITERIKNMRSHLRGVIIGRETGVDISIGAAQCQVIYPQAIAGGWQDAYESTAALGTCFYTGGIIYPQAVAGGWRDAYESTATVAPCFYAAGTIYPQAVAGGWQAASESTAAEGTCFYTGGITYPQAIK